jgi:glycosyltransferase involved in cell wall biosynthesis
VKVPGAADETGEAGACLVDLVTTGRLDDRKDHRFLLDALAASGKAGHRLTLDIYGDGPLKHHRGDGSRAADHRRGIGPLAELVDDGGEARFWPLDDPEQAAAIAAELLGSEEAMAKAGIAALERFRREYSAAVLGSQIRSFLLDPAGAT